MAPSVPKLKDQSLFVGKNYVDGQWIDSVSGKTFEVHGMAAPCENKVSQLTYHPIQTQPRDSS